MSPRSNRKSSIWSVVNFKKTHDLDELLTWARDIVTWYWSVDTLFWQVSVEHNMDSISETKAGCLCQAIIWIIAAMLRDSFVVVRTRPRAKPLAMITMRKSTHGFPFASHMGIGLRLAALRYYEFRQKFNFGMVSNFRSFLSALLR